MKGKIKKRFLIITIIAIGITALCFFLKIEVDEGQRIIEYGEPLSKNPEDYIKGFRFSINLCKLDFTDINENKIGEYKLYIKHGFHNYEIPIIIRDTVAPVIIKKKEQAVYEVNKEIPVSELIASVKDNDPNTDLVVKFGKEKKKSLNYHQTGQWSVVLQATDSSNNSSSETIIFSTDIAPEFSDVRDLYVAENTKDVSYLTYIKANDRKDGDITDDILIKSDYVKLNEPGDYNIYYEVTDSDGLKEEISAEVHVMSKESLEEKIGDREINWREDSIFGADNKFDAGAAVTDTLEEQLAYLIPTEVHLFFLYPNNPDIIDSCGSGFIIYMDETAVYICTNYHVISENGVGSCYFYDGSCAAIETLGYDKNYDIAILKVKRKNIKEETFGNLMSLHINKDEFEIAKMGEKPIFLQKLDKNGFDYYKTGKTISFGEIPFRLLPNAKTLASDLQSYYGSSGSAVMDYEGNLISMVSGFEDYKTGRIFHQIGALDIIRVFEEKTGIKLYSE